MSSSQNMLHQFNQNDYVGTFYECDNDHPFIAFTTCYCPLCDTMATIKEAGAELEEVEEALDMLKDIHLDLVAKVTKSCPELLI